jgi:hypothetical protein
MRDFSFPIDDCYQSLVQQCEIDYVEFWHLIAISRGAYAELMNDDLAELGPAELHDAAIYLARKLLESGKIVVMDVEEDGFRNWNCSADEAIDRIEARWRLLDGEPNAIDRVAVFWSLGSWQAYERGEIPPPKIF